MTPADPHEREAWSAGYQAGFRDAYKIYSVEEAMEKLCQIRPNDIIDAVDWRAVKRDMEKFIKPRRKRRAKR